MRLGLLGALVVSVTALASAEERHPAVYPPQKLPIRFSHKQHLDDGADCLSCHAAVRKSSKTADWNLPSHPECEDCHDIQAARRGKTVDPPSACSTCHPAFDPSVRKIPARVEIPPATIKFPHQLHLDRKVECKVCHGGVAQVDLATRQHLPKMKTCLECHDGVQASADCKTCHLATPGGRLQLSFISGLLRPMRGDPFGMDHGPRFEFNHGARATAARETCMKCHADFECQACHDALQKPLSVHPNDYLLLHPVEARVGKLECDSCHRAQSFCVACHARSGVMAEADVDSSLRGQISIHPDRFNFITNTSSPLHHGIQASRDLRQCISCHREETCMSCHSRASGLSVNPHGEGFREMCRTVAARNDRACLRCHTAEELREDGCR